MGLDYETVKQLILRLAKFGDGEHQGLATSPHGIGVALRLLVFLVGQRRLRNQGSQPGVLGGVDENCQLLVDDRQIFTGALQPLGHLGEAALDQ